MATMLASSPTQPPPKPPSLLPLSSAPRHHIPLPRRRARRLPIKPDLPLRHRLQESLSLLDLMESQSITPDPALLSILLSACADARDSRSGRLVHDRADRSGLHTDPFVANSLILMYSKCGLLGTARKLFDEMPHRNVVSWTTAISMYHHAGFPHDALDLYRSMTANTSVRPNAFTYTIALNSCASVKDFKLGVEIHKDVVRDGCHQDEFVAVALIDMYSKCGHVDRAREVFDAISNSSVEACTAMVEGYSANGDGKDAMDLVRRTLQSEQGDIASKLGFATIIRPCVSEMALRQGQEIHAHIIKSEHKPGMKTICALIDLYEKCGKFMNAYQLFSDLVVKDAGLWQRIISAFVKNGLYEEALEAFVDMACSGIALNPTVVSLAIEGCTGLLGFEEGRQIHGMVIKAPSLFSKSTVINGLTRLCILCGENEKAHKLTMQQRNHVSAVFD